MAGLSSFSAAKDELRKAIPRLVQLDNAEEIHSYLAELESLFDKHKEAFSTENREEITFSLDLMRASVDFQYGRFKNTMKFQEIRGEFFRETIKRAFEKAKRRNGSLVCYVGGDHASKVPHKKGDFFLGKWNEAEYFDRIYPETKGKVASIFLTPLTYQDQKGRVIATNNLEAIAYRLIGENKSLLSQR